MYTFRKLCRENTGKHILDSGGACGRHWQQEPIPENSPVIKIDTYRDREGYLIPEPYLETGAWLDELFTIDQTETGNLREFSSRDEYKYKRWPVIISDYMERKGYVSAGRDNTYNGENNLSQQILWQAFVPRGTSDEWYYNSETMLILQTHNGADVRGGYSAPVVLEKERWEEPYLAFLSPVIGVHAIEGFRPSDKSRLDRRTLDGISERWQIASTRAPLYTFQNDVNRIFGFTLDRERGQVWCEVEGQAIKVTFYSSAMHC